MKNTKLDIFKILIIVMSFSLVFLWLHYVEQNTFLKIESEGLSYVETLNAGVQRTSKLILEGDSDIEMMIILEGLYSELSPEIGNYFVKDETLIPMMEEYLYDMVIFQLAVRQFREDGNREILFIISEQLYSNAGVVENKLKNYINSIEETVQSSHFFLIINIVIIGLLLVAILFKTVKELNKNKELSKEMFIDTSTGLYNHSKCQEILKNSVTQTT